MRNSSPILDTFFKLKGQNIIQIFLKGAGLSSILKVLSVILGFVSQIVLARFMGVEQYGIYTYIYTWFNILWLFSRMGWDTVLVRYISAYASEEKWGLFRGVMQSSQKYSLVASILVASTVMAIFLITKQQGNREIFWTLIISLLMLPLWTISQLQCSILRSLKNVVLFQIPYLFHFFIFTLLVTISSFQEHEFIPSSMVMILNLCASFMTLALSTHLLAKALPVKIKSIPPQYRIKEWTVAALSLLLTSGIYLLLNQIDIIMVGFFRGTDQAGIYSASSRVSMLLAFGLSSTSMIAAPMISELYATRQIQKMQQIVNLTLLISLAFALPIFFGIIFGGRFILDAFGADFSQGFSILCTLASAQLFNVLTGPSGFLMTMTNHHRQYVKILGFSLVSNAIMNLILLSVLGAVGAALATAITNIVMNTLAVVFIRKNMNIKSFLWADFML